MKPSERIKQIVEAMMTIEGRNPNDKIMSFYEKAILKFLDEELEKFTRK